MALVMMQFQQNSVTTVPHTPPPIKLSHRPISFSTSKRIVQQVTLDDCHSDCDSSSSVVDDGDDCVISSLSRKIFPLNLNLPPSMTMDEADDDGDDFRATALCL
ncbi:hypothetical protein QYF36_003389 [Acer negundo]|nr:hypothetical protein QYF36_003389 [Acer negundo]